MKFLTATVLFAAVVLLPTVSYAAGPELKLTDTTAAAWRPDSAQKPKQSFLGALASGLRIGATHVKLQLGTSRLGLGMSFAL